MCEHEPELADEVSLQKFDRRLETAVALHADEIQIADDWIEGKPLLAGLRGRSISIPVRGTVAKPLFDKNVIKHFSQNLVNKATGGLLNDKIKRESDKLFGKIGEELGISPANQPGINNELNSPNNFDPNQLEEKIQGELIKGIGNLFGK